MKFLFALLSTLSLTGCFFSKTTVVPLEYQGDAFGSYYIVKYVSGPTTPDPQSLKAETEEMIKQYNQAFSLWQADSFLAKFNQSSSLEASPVHPWGIEMMKAARYIWQETSGAYDPTVAPLVKLWGFGPNKDPHIPSDAEIKKTMQQVGLDKLIVDEKSSTWKKKHPGLQVDVNSIAPGQFADIIGAMLEKRGIKEYLVDVGGELLARGDKGGEPWVVGIERPTLEHAQGIVARVPLNDHAIATSGNYRNFKDTTKGRISHTIDPRTGKQPNHRTVSVTVVAKNAMEADAWATALMVIGPEALDENHAMSKVLQNEGLKVLLLEGQSDGTLREYLNSSMKALLGQ